MMNSNEGARRFTDPGTSLDEMLDEILVVCPRCHACARITPTAPAPTQDPMRPGLFAPRRLVCVHCGYTREWAEKRIRRSGNSTPVVDDFFDEPLWLQEPFDGKVLWAYNLRHLSLIEAYVAADLREHRRDPVWKNRSLINRLPRWISSAKNRERVLKALEKLRARYVE
jgi:hypothetical protein